MKKVSASIRDEHMDLVEEREGQEGINSKARLSALYSTSIKIYEPSMTNSEKSLKN